jgi:hypothetical protein
MAGYSKTPLSRKLGVDGERSVRLLCAPAGFEKVIGLKKGDRRLVSSPRSTADIVILFAQSKSELNRGLPKAHRAMAVGGGIWIAWPKKSSGVASDLSEDIVRAAGLRLGLVDYKVCAIDAT